MHSLDYSLNFPVMRNSIFPWRDLLQRFLCVLFGHQVDNRRFKAEGRLRCPCGKPVLREDGSRTRISHTVSCFFLGHHYQRIITRSGYTEYACTTCGHPLLFSEKGDPFCHRSHFKKKVRYICNLFGHDTRKVAGRHGLHEYACLCGHSFLKNQEMNGIIKHPLICLFAGHLVSFVGRRAGFVEHLCQNCGHTFLFDSPV